MTINAPVQATIIKPDDVSVLADQHYHWMWGRRKEVAPPSHDEMCQSFTTAFTETPDEVTFMVAYELPGGMKMIDFISGRVTKLEYESGSVGMLLFSLATDDKRWTKINGFLNCRPVRGWNHGWISLTARR